MKKEEYLYAIESILFVSPKPVRIDKIASTLGLDKGSVNELLLELENNLKGTGINIAFEKNKVSMVPNPSYRRYFEKFIKRKKVTLSKNLIEVIGLVLKKKRTKEEIDKIRGVNSTRVINELLKLGYIEKEFFEGKIYYKVTDKFIETLPEDVREDLEARLFKF
jgi:segregation and condensation protein B